MHWGYPLHGKETNNHGRTQFFEYNRQTKKRRRRTTSKTIANLNKTARRRRHFLLKNIQKYPYK